VSTRTHRTLRTLAWLILGGILALYIGFPVVMAAAAVWPARSDVAAAPDGFGDVTLTTASGTELAGWYSAGENGAAILVMHGAGGSRDGVRAYAEMLALEGYGVLAIDAQGHGESGGRTNRLGWRGTEDVEAAVAFLQEQDGVERIGALGSSMGGEIVLGACAACPEIRAIVSDGATHRSTAELLALPSERPIVRNFVPRVMHGAVRLFAWDSPPPPLLEEMQRARDTRYLLIAAGEEPAEVAYNELFASALDDRATLWTVPGVTHTRAYASDPDEFERRVLGFFGEELLGE